MIAPPGGAPCRRATAGFGEEREGRVIENHRLGGTAFLSRWCAVGLLALSMGCQTQAPPARPSASADPLASWNDNTTKRSIIDFVQLVTTPGGPSFVPVPERIAVFDNDGTLWAEQ